MFAGLDDCFLNGGEFTSETEMNWEGHIEFDLGALATIPTVTLDDSRCAPV